MDVGKQSFESVEAAVEEVEVVGNQCLFEPFLVVVMGPLKLLAHSVTVNSL
jgi:hypothetical protein